MAKADTRMTAFKITVVLLTLGGLLMGPALFALGFFMHAELVSAIQIVSAASFGLGFILLGAWSEKYEDGTDRTKYEPGDFWFPIFLLKTLAFHVLVIAVHTHSLPTPWETAWLWLGIIMLATSVCLMLLRLFIVYRQNQ